ncbi:NAD(P)H-binding protein [Streptomyces sp. NPDC002896]|uniref:NAD(P)-dependent oxidoreductase n=1 Tax=Streptomyces sp. NPDC002896 TaxID=3154438 RepID=UPI003333DC61
MKIAVLGHTGMGGKAISDALVERGHEVVGLSTHGEKIASRPGLTSRTLDIWDTEALTEALRGQDVVVSAFAGGHTMDPAVFYRHTEGTRRVIKAFKNAGAGYLLYVGGAASLYVKPDVQMFDDERFPHWYFGTAPAVFLHWLGDITGQEFFHEAAARRERGELGEYELDPVVEEYVKAWDKVPLLEACRISLDLFVGRTDFTWSFLSPPWLYRPGKGSGTYRLGVDYMIFHDGGRPAGINVPDLALAVADEAESRVLVHKHWTVAGDQHDS